MSILVYRDTPSFKFTHHLLKSQNSTGTQGEQRETSADVYANSLLLKTAHTLFCTLKANTRVK